jgi:heme exporter protein D
VIVELSISWANASDDTLVNNTACALVQGIITDAKELGGYDPYIFANYARTRIRLMMLLKATVQRASLFSERLGRKLTQRRFQP